MSRVVIIEKNKDGKIELTKDELQKILDDAYSQGYADGNKKYDVLTYPSYPNWIYQSCSTDKITLNG